METEKREFLFEKAGESGSQAALTGSLFDVIKLPKATESGLIIRTAPYTSHSEQLIVVNRVPTPMSRQNSRYFQGYSRHLFK
jgi:hypothetical protein